MLLVFGVPLEVLALRQKSQRPIPTTVIKCVDYLVSSGKTVLMSFHGFRVNWEWLYFDEISAIRICRFSDFQIVNVWFSGLNAEYIFKKDGNRRVVDRLIVTLNNGILYSSWGLKCCLVTPVTDHSYAKSNLETFTSTEAWWRGFMENCVAVVMSNIRIVFWISDPSAVLQGVSPMDVAALLKVFFQMLPEPLLMFENYDAFVAARGNVARLREVIACLPPANYLTLECLTALLLRISQKSTINKVGFSFHSL